MAAPEEWIGPSAAERRIWAKDRGKALAAIQLFLVRCGGDSHFCHSSHFFKVFSACDVVLPFVFKVFYGHIGMSMNVAF
jgi:hypothetical protein